MSEEVFVYLCDRVQDEVERIRAQARQAEENPQEVTRPLVRLLATKVNRSYSEYEKHYFQLIDVCAYTELEAYAKKREEFDELFRETCLAIQSMELILLYPPVQLLQHPQETRTEAESIVAPKDDGEIGRSVATCSPLLEPTPTETTKVVIMVGEPSFPSLSNVITSHDVLYREHPPATSEKPSPEVEPPPNDSSSSEPAEAAESALSPTVSDSQTVTVGAQTGSQTILTDEPDSSATESHETATSPCAAQ